MFVKIDKEYLVNLDNFDCIGTEDRGNEYTHPFALVFKWERYTSNNDVLMYFKSEEGRTKAFDAIEQGLSKGVNFVDISEFSEIC